jgi:hypothetical protein
MGRTGRVRPRLLSTILTSSHRSTPRSIPPLAPPRWKAHRSHSGSGPPVGRGTCPLRIYAAATIPRPTAADLGSGSRNWLLHFPQFCPPKRRLCAWSIEAHIAMLPKRRPHDLRRQLARSSGSAVGSQPTLGSVPFPFERAAQPVSTRLQNPDLRPWRCRRPRDILGMNNMPMPIGDRSRQPGAAGQMPSGMPVAARPRTIEREGNHPSV